MQLSLADEAVRSVGSLDPQQRLLLQSATENAVDALKKLRLRVLQRKAEAAYRSKNLVLLASKQRARVARNPELQRRRVSESNKRHRKERNAYERRYYIQNKEKCIARNRRSESKHPETRRKRLPIYRAANREHIREYHRKYRPEWRKKQVETNPEFVLKDRMRSCLKRGLSNHNLKKTARTEAMVGCTMAHLRAHIEAQFQPGMSWSNPASYSIDHIIPLCAFNLLDEEERFWSFNWRNLRPMDLTENKAKHARVEFPLPQWLPYHIADRIMDRCSGPQEDPPT